MCVTVYVCVSAPAAKHQTQPAGKKMKMTRASGNVLLSLTPGCFHTLGHIWDGMNSSCLSLGSVRTGNSLAKELGRHGVNVWRRSTYTI